jgi:hypothetical protein
MAKAKTGQWVWIAHDDGRKGLLHRPDYTLLLTDAQVTELKIAPRIGAFLTLLFAIVGVGNAGSAALDAAFNGDHRSRAEQIEEIRSVVAMSADGALPIRRTAAAERAARERALGGAEVLTQR